MRKKETQAPQIEIEDMLERAVNSGESYSPEELKQELKFSIAPVKGIQDFNDIDGEKIYCIIGSHGAGKTSIMHQLAQETESEIYSFNLGGTVQEDLHGLPIIGEKNGIKVATRASAEFCPPFYRKPNSKSGIGIWLLDEIFSGVSNDHQLFVRMVAGGKCDELRMFPGWFIVGTSNPPCAEYLTVQKLDSSTADRFIFFCINTTADDKLRYWRPRMHPLTYRFLLLNHIRKLSYIDSMSARSWWNISKELGKRQALSAPISSMVRLLTTHANIEVASAFTAYLKHGDDPAYYPISAKELLYSDDIAFKRAMNIVQVWIKDDNTPLIGATKWDLNAWIIDEVVGKKIEVPETYIKRLSSFLIELGSNNYADLVDDVLMACRQTPLMEALINAIRGSKAMEEIIKARKAYTEKSE